MGEEQKKILQMLAEGKITVDEATRLLSVVGSEAGRESPPTGEKSKTNPRYLYVKVEPKAGSQETDKVLIRVPFGLIRAGVKFKNLIPPQAADEIDKNLKQSGIAFDIRNLKDEDLEPLIDALQDMEINVESNEHTVKVYAE